MGEVWIKESTLTAIGDAVRAKTGVSGLLSPEKMLEGLSNIKDSGKYLFSKKVMANEYTTTSGTATKTLVTQGENISEVEIEIVVDAPALPGAEKTTGVLYNSEKGIWEFVGGTVVTLVNTDTDLPSGVTSGAVLTPNTMIRLTSEPNIWYSASKITTSSMDASGTCAKTMTYSAKYEAPVSDILGYAVSDDLTKYPDGGWKDGYYWELVSKIEFKIRNNNGNYVTFYAAEGMTWAEFVDSEYNTQGIYIAGTSVLYGNEIRTSSGVSVTPTDIIMNDGSYNAMGGGSN